MSAPPPLTAPFNLPAIVHGFKLLPLSRNKLAREWAVYVKVTFCFRALWIYRIKYNVVQAIRCVSRCRHRGGYRIFPEGGGQRHELIKNYVPLAYQNLIQRGGGECTRPGPVNSVMPKMPYRLQHIHILSCKMQHCRKMLQNPIKKVLCQLRWWTAINFMF